MARVTHTAIAVPGSQNFTGTAITFVGRSSSLEQVVLTGTEMILARNTTGGALSVTVTSVNDPFGRTKDIAVQDLAANEFRIFGPFSTTGWAQTDGNLYFEGEATGIDFIVLKLALP